MSLKAWPTWSSRVDCPMFEQEQPGVLIVDDDPLIRRLVKTTLRGAPIRVLEAATALEALKVARESHPSLVLLDIRLGPDDGVRLCAALKTAEVTRGVRVLMLSARDDPRTRERARKAGADGFFAKPFSPLALWRAIDALVASSGAPARG
jgi:DNA-binding response OmpR family regulator